MTHSEVKNSHVFETYYKFNYNIPLQSTYDKTLFRSHVQKTIYHCSFDVTTMFKKW